MPTLLNIVKELSDRFVKHLLEVVKAGDFVNVKLLSVDTKKNGSRLP